jgi:cobalt-zinc-cadmium efflux system outer membrane protein
MIRRVFGPLVVVSLLLTAGWGQQPLDLKTALAEADTNNLELRAALQQRVMALAGISTARQIPNPTVTFGALRDVPHESLTIDEPFELGGKRGNRIAVAREEHRGTELDIAALRRQIRRRTRESFFRALTAAAQAEQSKAALDLATRTKDVVRQRFEAGDVAELEVIQADVELARADTDYQLALQVERAAEVQLAALLNRNLTAGLNLSGRAEELPAIVSLEQLSATAMQSNSDLVKTLQAMRTEERRLALAKSQRVPNIDLQAGVDLDAPPDFNVGSKGQITMQLPLFYREQGEISLSRARLELLRLTADSQRVNTAAQVTAAYYDFTAKAHQAEQYRKRMVPETIKLEEMARESYQAGKSNLLTLIDAQRKLNDVKKAYLDSLLSVQTSFASLEELAGAPLD